MTTNTKSRSKKEKKQKKQTQQIQDKEIDEKMKKEGRATSRNVVIFTGRALVEILRDQTMQKSFMTLAYISDMMIGSEIMPLQKQKLIKIARSYVGEGEYVSAIVSTAED